MTGNIEKNTPREHEHYNIGYLIYTGSSYN